MARCGISVNVFKETIGTLEMWMTLMNKSVSI